MENLRRLRESLFATGTMVVLGVGISTMLSVDLYISLCIFGAYGSLFTGLDLFVYFSSFPKQENREKHEN